MKSTPVSHVFNWVRQTKGSRENSSEEKQRSEVTCPRSLGISHFCLPVHRFSLPGIKWVNPARHISLVMSSQVGILIPEFQEVLVLLPLQWKERFPNNKGCRIKGEVKNG